MGLNLSECGHQWELWSLYLHIRYVSNSVLLVCASCPVKKCHGREVPEQKPEMKSVPLSKHPKVEQQNCTMKAMITLLISRRKRNWKVTLWSWRWTVQWKLNCWLIIFIELRGWSLLARLQGLWTQSTHWREESEMMCSSSLFSSCYCILPAWWLWCLDCLNYECGLWESVALKWLLKPRAGSVNKHRITYVKNRTHGCVQCSS